MPLSKALWCAATLSMLPVVAAQGGATPSAVATRSSAGELTFRAGDVLVRRWRQGGIAKAALSRDDGRSWQPLADPDDRLHFVLAQYDPAEQPLRLPGPMGAPAGNRLFLVQFQTQVLEQYQHLLRQCGVEILHYLPENALAVRGDRSQLAALRELPCVRWADDLQNGFKLDATLREFALSNGEAPMACNLVLGRKSDRRTLAAQIVALGGKVSDLCEGSVLLQASLTPAQLLAVMALDTVTYADPTPARGFDMDNARIQGGAVYVNTFGSFDGTGVRAEITERFDETHPDLVGRVLARSAGADSHGHCTAGIVGGSGAGNAAATGMMPNCTLIEGAYTATSHYAQMVGSTDPALPWQAMLATASWGSAVTTLYTTVSQDVDDGLFDSDLTRLNSQGNTGNQNSRPEAWAKNILSVGGVAHGDDANPANDAWTMASYGPASDSRQKPDLCAFSDNVATTDLPGAAGFNTTPGAAGDYFPAFSGTSAATPICAGHLGIVHQMFTDGLFGNPLPLPATAANRFRNKPHLTTSKALLCGTARPYPVTQVERRKQGWGFPDLACLYDNRQEIVVVDEYETLQQGRSRTYYVAVAAGQTEFRAAMCYADPAAQATAAIHRVNNLDLKVTRLSDGTFWWGNNGLTTGTAGGDVSTSGGVANDRDTLEMVLLRNPQPGLYTVVVSAASIVVDGKVETPALDADFALVMFPTAGFRNDTGMTMDLQSTGPGNLSVHCANVPTGGWTDGFTSLSFQTARAKAFGNFFGIEFDFLTEMVWTLGATPGDVFHFTNQPGSYPFVPYTFDPSIVSALVGLSVDAQVTLFQAGTLAAQSNVDRITIQ